MKQNRFKVIEYSSFYAVRDTMTGNEAHMGDGVDALFNEAGKAYRPGTKAFIRRWEQALNSCPSETEEAYNFSS